MASAHRALQLQEDEGFDCAICLGLLVDPVVGLCGHDFCHRCLKRWVKQQRRSFKTTITCPMCRKVFASTSKAAELGVCIRLRNMIAQRFPMQLAARRAELQQESSSSGRSLSDAAFGGGSRQQQVAPPGAQRTVVAAVTPPVTQGDGNAVGQAAAGAVTFTVSRGFQLGPMFMNLAVQQQQQPQQQQQQQQSIQQTWRQQTAGRTAAEALAPADDSTASITSPLHTSATTMAPNPPGTTNTAPPVSWFDPWPRVPHPSRQQQQH